MARGGSATACTRAIHHMPVTSALPNPSGVDPVPVVDLATLRSPLHPGDAVRRTAVLERLRRACTTCGTFYLENHGVPDSVLRHAMAQVDAFFDLPLEERMEIAVPPGHGCGYEPLDARGFNDSFNCVVGTEAFAELADLPDPGPNRWPRRPAGFEAMVRHTAAALHRVGVEVLSALALSLELPADHFVSLIGPPEVGSVRARRYPPRGPQEHLIGTNPHVDGLPLAFILQNEVPGLQTEVPGAGWKTVAPRPDTIVCQLGSLFGRWTNDRYVPNRHRVVNDDPCRERRSIIYWFPIHPEAVITCVPTCCGPDDPPRYPPIRYMGYVNEWVRGVS